MTPGNANCNRPAIVQHFASVRFGARALYDGAMTLSADQMTLSVDQMTCEELAALVGWYAEMGVDVCIGETPVDSFAAGAQALQQMQDAPAAARSLPATPDGGRLDRDGAAPARRAPVARASAPPPPPDEAALAARELAAAAPTLDALREALEGFTGCGLKRTASQLVFEDGARQARVMLVGDAPGDDDDRQGRPFAGAEGRLLDAMLKEIGLERTQVYLAHAVPWRPPGKRAPTQQEAAICLPFIQRQIALSQPQILVCLGNLSVQMLLGVREGATRVRGRWFDYALTNGAKVPALAMLSPGLLLKSPISKREAWRDMLELRKALEAGGQ